MNKMKNKMIPDKFTLGGITYKVRYEARSDDDTVGRFKPNQAEVILYKNGNNDTICQESMEDTFFHELVHGILQAMGHKLYENEEFVQSFSTLLHQYMKSKTNE